MEKKFGIRALGPAEKRNLVAAWVAACSPEYQVLDSEGNNVASIDEIEPQRTAAVLTEDSAVASEVASRSAKGRKRTANRTNGSKRKKLRPEDEMMETPLASFYTDQVQRPATTDKKADVEATKAALHPGRRKAVLTRPVLQSQIHTAVPAADQMTSPVQFDQRYHQPRLDAAACETSELALALRRKQMAENASFHEAFLCIMGELVETMCNRRVTRSPQ
ncbi:unnamed protein product [Ophioblennius macclurei]